MNLIRFLAELIPGRRKRKRTQDLARSKGVSCSSCKKGLLVRTFRQPPRPMEGWVSTWVCMNCGRHVYVRFRLSQEAGGPVYLLETIDEGEVK